MQKTLLNLLATAAIAGCGLLSGCAPDGPARVVESSAPAGAAAQADTGAQLLARAFAEQRSNLQVEARGVVVKTLADDDRGSRHQRFIVQLDTGQTVLLAHNIDLARRVDGLRSGDAVAFYGEYEWNERGGVIHWTHRDPRGTHPAGWIRHGGRLYQ